MNKKTIKLNFMNSSENPDASFLPKSNPSVVLPAQIDFIFKNVQEKKLWSPEVVRSGKWQEQKN